MKRIWKALPEEVRESAHLGLQAASHRLTPLWVRLNWRRGRPPGGAVTIAGFYTSSLGIGRGVRLLTAALRQGGMSVQAFDVGRALRVSSDLGAEAGAGGPEAADRAVGGVLISHFNPPELYRWVQRTRGRPLRGRRHIGYWAWELPTLPQGWREAFAYVDEVWCPSHFTAEAVRAAAPAGLPVRVVAHPVFMTPQPAPDRARFGLPDGACVVLTAFDLKSTLARKNPLGAIEAYRHAAPQADGASLLVCKLTPGRTPAERRLEAQVEAAVAGRPDIVLLRDALSEADMNRLVASVDVVLSLHRAEGFGLLAAEGLWLGKPVVATAWSGVMDFLDAESSALVPWAERPVQDAQGMYTEGWWAEPDLAYAARALQTLIRSPPARAALGERARHRADQVFEPSGWLARIAALLDEAPLA